MRFVDIARIAALISIGALSSGCPKKDAEAVPEPPTPAAAQPTSDKAGAEAAPAAPAAPAPAAKKKDDDKGGW